MLGWKLRGKRGGGQDEVMWGWKGDLWEWNWWRGIVRGGWDGNEEGGGNDKGVMGVGRIFRDSGI